MVHGVEQVVCPRYLVDLDVFRRRGGTRGGGRQGENIIGNDLLCCSFGFRRHVGDVQDLVRNPREMSDRRQVTVLAG
jgi:hypothetical protein